MDCCVFFQALDTFNTAIVTPIYYAMFTSLTIFSSAIMYKVFNSSLWYYVIVDFRLIVILILISPSTTLGVGR